MFFTTDVNNVLKIEDAREYLNGVHRDIMPLMESMIRAAAIEIKETFDVDVFETMEIRRHPNPRPTTKTLREKYELEDRYVSCELTGKTRKEGYPNVAHNRLWKMHPSYLGFRECGGMFDVQFAPFASGRHDEKFVAIVERFFRDNWKSMREFLHFLFNYKTGEFVESATVDDVGQYIHTVDGYTCLTFAVGGVELEDIQDIRNLEDASRDDIWVLFIMCLVHLYPFLHVCVCLAKGESTDSFFVMLEKLRKLTSEQEVLTEPTETEKTNSDDASVIDTIPNNTGSPDTAKDTANSIDVSTLVRSEGSQRQALCTRYERDPKLREACAQRDKWTCVICGRNFEDKYGDIGKDFIHVHHIEAISSRGGEYNATLDDVCAVCPNCHAMLHRQKPALTPDELRKMLKASRDDRN